ncbi:glycerol-3-phosphate acyltransferase [Pseudoneobacillus sp. C159]
MIAKVISVILFSYFLGSITGAYYLTKWMVGKDIRKLGSGNVGARNAGRQLGKKGFLYTVIIDATKVLIALLITSALFPQNDRMLLVSALCLLIGHIWPLHLGFKGGKGVVVYLAITLYFVPVAILVVGACVGIGYLLVKNFTITGLISMISIPITAWIVGENDFAIGLMILLIIVIIPHLTRK